MHVYYTHVATKQIENLTLHCNSSKRQASRHVRSNTDRTLILLLIETIEIRHVKQQAEAEKEDDKQPVVPQEPRVDLMVNEVIRTDTRNTKLQDQLQNRRRLKQAQQAKPRSELSQPAPCGSSWINADISKIRQDNGKTSARILETRGKPAAAMIESGR